MARMSAFKTTICAITMIAAVFAQPVLAQSLQDRKLFRLAEILGSLHYISNLCGEKNTQWRDQLAQLIESENPDLERRARLYAAFNDAYRAFSEHHHSCNASAVEAGNLYKHEGEKLTQDILRRYGN